MAGLGLLLACPLPRRPDRPPAHRRLCLAIYLKDEVGMRKLTTAAHRRPSRAALIVGAALSLGALAMPAAATAATAMTRASVPLSSAGVRPGATGEIDCNGLSPIQRPVKPDMACADIRGGGGGRVSENGHYIGHDEASLRFLSVQPGRGVNFTMTENLPVDPSAMPTVKQPGHDV